MKIMALGLAIASMSVALPACASYDHGGYAYNAYYDDAYGPYYDGYWGDDGFFWYRGDRDHSNSRPHPHGNLPVLWPFGASLHDLAAGCQAASSRMMP